MPRGLIQFIFIATALLLLPLPELFLGAVGVPLPLAAPLVFCLTAAAGYRAGAVSAIGLGVWFDLLYGRDFPVSVWALLAVVLVASLQHREHPDHRLALTLPAFLALLAGEAVWALGVMPPDPVFAELLRLAGGVIGLAAFGTAAALGLSWLLDHTAWQLGLECSAIPHPAARTRQGGIPGRTR